MAQQTLELNTSHKETTEKFPFILWLTVPVLVFTAIVAYIGFINPNTYSNSQSLAVQGQAQDLVTLIIVLPLLILSTWFAVNQKITASIIWLGAMLYIAYTYTIAAFQVEFNQLFLLYVIILGCSFYATIIGVFQVRVDAVRIIDTFPVRAVSVFLVVIALMYYALWLSTIIPAIVANTVPEAVTLDNIPTSAVHVLDMGFFLPLLFIASYFLWQRKGMGILLTGVSFVFIILMGIAVMAMIVNMFQANITDSIAPLYLFLVTTLITGGLLYMLLKSIKLE